MDKIQEFMKNWPTWVQMLIWIAIGMATGIISAAGVTAVATFMTGCGSMHKVQMTCDHKTDTTKMSTTMTYTQQGGIKKN